MSLTPAFEEMFDLKEIQLLQDQFAAATGVASVISRPDGTPITKPSRFHRLCREIFRTTDKGLANCSLSGTQTGNFDSADPIIRPCSSCGLLCSSAAITVGGEHIATWQIGQVRDETQDEESIRAYARETGADETDAVLAFREIPTMSREQFEKVSEVVFTMAQRLSAGANLNLQQAQFSSGREAAEKAVRRSENFYRTLIDTIPDLVWLKDIDGVYISCNRNFERLYDARESDIVGRTDYDFVDQELADYFRYHDNKAVESGQPRTNEEWLTFARNGYRGLFETVKTPLHDADGNFVGILGIAHEISARKKTEQNLREAEERFRSLHNASFGGIAIHDRGVILECNQGLASMTGYAVEELIGMDGLLLIAEPSRDFVIQKITSGYELPYEAVGLRRNGEEYPLRLEGKNVPYKGQAVRTVEFRDITEIKHAEDQQRELQAQLNQAQKMESVGQLAGGVAHDFNNLLQVILGFGEIALESSKRDHQIYASVEQMMKAAERARKLVGQLLAFSRRQVLDMQNVNLNDIIGDMLKILRRIIGEHVDLRFVPGRDLGVVRADSGQLGQILTNLCVNARDAMPDGGRITIETGNVRVDPGNRGDHFGKDPGHYVLMTVSDTGTGIDAAVLDHVFEPFFTTKEVGEGTGLGLSTVYGLVKQHEGTVHVSSEDGRGTTFRIYLPLSEHPSADIIAQPTGSAHGGTETILLAEDDDMVRELTCAVLQHHGYKVLVARNGQEALSVFDRHADQIDLLLLDVIMPNLNGRAVYDRIRQTHPDLPTLFASGYSIDAVHTGFILDEGLSLIQKPAKRDELLRKVREVLDAS